MKSELDEVELKPCPFCGRKPRTNLVFTPTLDDDEINSYLIACDNCDIEMWQDWDFGEIVKKWNTRNGE